MAQQTGNTHAQRKHAKRIKSEWTERLAGGAASLDDLVAAAQGDSDDARYLGSITLASLMEKVHPALSKAQVIAELSALPIKAPNDPTKFSIRSIRSRPEVVEKVAALLKSSAVTKSARGRTEIPSNWPWSTKLSELIRANNGEVPQGLEFLETGEGDVDPGDLLLASPNIEPLAPSDDGSKDDETGESEADAVEQSETPDESEAESSDENDEDSVDPLADFESSLDFDDKDEAEDGDEGDEEEVDPDSVIDNFLEDID